MESNAKDKQELNDYYDPLDVKSVFKVRIQKDDKIEIFKPIKDDPYEVERVHESAKLTLSKIGSYEMPEYDETKIVGELKKNYLNNFVYVQVTSIVA